MHTRHEFEGRDQLAKGLAEAVAGDLKRGIGARGAASLAVSGGSTPGAFFEQLATHEDVDWAKVTVTLVDERWVNENSERSNARLVKQNLLQDLAFAARFVPLYAGGDVPTLELVKTACDWQQAVPMPFDAVVLGMGGDGHTASFFPQGDNLEQALTDNGPLIAINAPGAGEPRITFTLPMLLATNALYLHIEGQAKASVLQKAQDPAGPIAEMPIRAVLRQQTTELKIFCCA